MSIRSIYYRFSCKGSMFEKYFTSKLKVMMKKIFCAALILFSLNNFVSGQESSEKNGPWQNMYANGKLKTTGQFHHGIPIGEFTHYYEDGKKRASVVFSNNGRIAQSTTYYPTGNVMAVGKYIDQQKDSTWLYYADSTDKLLSKEHYIHGNLEGESITYYPGTKQAAEIIIYKKGKKQGPLLKYFPDGSLMTRGTYVNDLLDGEFFLYYPDGKPQLIGAYSKGEQIGDWKYFDEEGNEMSYDDFVNQSSKPIEVADPDQDPKNKQPF